MLKKLNVALLVVNLLILSYGAGLQSQSPDYYAWAQTDINDAQALKFVNEQVRPVCERVRGLKAVIDSMIIDWYAVQGLFPNDSSPVQDGREAQGVSRLTGEDINTVMYQLTVIQNALDAGGVEAAIAKPCVRPLAVIGE